jgi:hypothetical protein
VAGSARHRRRARCRASSTSSARAGCRDVASPLTLSARVRGPPRVRPATGVLP